MAIHVDFKDYLMLSLFLFLALFINMFLCLFRCPENQGKQETVDLRIWNQETKVQNQTKH